MNGRLTSIDALKGMAITLVVVGHCLGWSVVRYVYWFHMPLFFLLSGYLLNEKYTVPRWLARRTRHLLVPYLSFFVLFVLAAKLAYRWGVLAPGSGDVPEKLRYTVDLGFNLTSIWNYAVGGGRWWFITTLFCAQVLGFLVWRYVRRDAMWWSAVTALYVLALVDFCFLESIRFPFYLDTVPLATVFYLLGARIGAEERAPGGWAIPRVVWLLMTATLLLFLLTEQRGLLYHEFRLKQTVLGIPFVNLFLPLLAFLVLKRWAGRLSTVPYVSRVLCELGKAAMIIFFANQDILLVAVKINQRLFGGSAYDYGLGSATVIMALCLAVPYAIYVCLARYRWTRALFLGE